MTPLRLLVPALAGLAGLAEAAAQDPTDLRLQLRQLVDCANPPATIELDGRIFEIPALLRTAATMGGPRPSATAVDLILVRILTDRLRGMGHTVSDEELEAHLDALREREQNPFVQLVSQQAGGYPSAAVFAAWLRVRLAFVKSLPKKIEDAELQRFMNQPGSGFGQRRLALEGVFFIAREDGQDRWDYAGAARRAAAARAAIRGGDLAAIRNRGHHYITGKGLHGVLNLRRDFGETEYTDLAYGTQAARLVFAKGEPGEILGPFRTPDCYWVVKVSKVMISGIKNLGLVDPRQREQIRQAYVKDRFQAWVRATLGKLLLKRRPAK